MADIYLEEDSYQIDTFGNLKIDKQIFDDFEADAVITICFLDEEEQVREYIMRSENEEYIFCEILA